MLSTPALTALETSLAIFEGEKVPFGVGGCRGDDLLARARSDLQRHSPLTPEKLGQIEPEVLRDGRVSDSAARLDDVT